WTQNTTPSSTAPSSKATAKKVSPPTPPPKKNNPHSWKTSTKFSSAWKAPLPEILPTASKNSSKEVLPAFSTNSQTSIFPTRSQSSLSATLKKNSVLSPCISSSTSSGPKSNAPSKKDSLSSTKHGT